MPVIGAMNDVLEQAVAAGFHHDQVHALGLRLLDHRPVGPFTPEHLARICAPLGLEALALGGHDGVAQRFEIPGG